MRVSERNYKRSNVMLDEVSVQVFIKGSGK